MLVVSLIYWSTPSERFRFELTFVQNFEIDMYIFWHRFCKTTYRKLSQSHEQFYQSVNLEVKREKV